MSMLETTEYICKKAYKCIWLIRRLKTLGCVVWFSLSVQQSLDLRKYLNCNIYYVVTFMSWLSIEVTNSFHL